MICTAFSSWYRCQIYVWMDSHITAKSFQRFVRHPSEWYGAWVRMCVRGADALVGACACALLRSCACVPTDSWSSESWQDVQLCIWVWTATLSHTSAGLTTPCSAHVHFAVQHLYFTATRFQSWKTCIWCWKLSSHHVEYFQTNHLMPEVWKKKVF